MDDGSGKDAASLNMDDFSDYIHQYGPLIATFQRNHSGAIAKPATSDVDAEAHVAECYAKVPRIFFASNFNLRDPAIFAAALNSGVVVENNTGTGTGTGGGVDDDEALSESAAPQQHGRRQPGGGSSEEEASMKVLSGHLETTELSLLSLVSSRSDSFFSQLQNLQVFREQITSTCHAIVDTRVSLDNIRKRFVAGNIRVPHLTRRRSGLQKVQHLVQLILQVQQTQQIVQANLEEGHFGAALDTIEAAQVALQGPLAAIGSLRSVRVQLDSFVKLIANTMASRFLDLAVSMNVLVLDDALPSSSFDDDADAAATTTITTANDAEAAAENAQLSRRVAFKEKILPLVKGLVRVGQLRQVMAKYRGRLTEVVTLVVRTAVSASLEASNTAAAKSGGEDDDDDDSAAAGGDGASAANAKNGRAGSRKSNPGANGKFPSVVTKLRSLNDQEFQSMLKDVLDHLMSVVSQAASVHAMLLVALEDTRDDSDAAGDESPRTDGRVVESRRESASTLRQKSLQRDGCERDSREALEHMWRIAQRHIGRMFDIREKELAAQPLSKQKALWDMVSSFVTRAQKKCGRRGDTLLNTLMAQVKKYLEHSHARLRGRLEHALTHDGWGEAQILPSHAETLRAITCYANGVDPAAAAAGANGSTETGGDGAAGIALSSSLANANPNAPLKRLHFQGEDYHVPGCVLELLAAIQVHLQCTQDFSAHVTTIMHQILELLSLYNQRTTDLILGTGALALETSSLKRITDKHLALVSQSLRLLQRVVPFIKDALSRHMSTRQHLLLQDFDRKSADLELHNSQIYDKFIAITAGLVDDKCSKIPAQRSTWGTPGAAVPSPFMAELVKGISTLRKHMVNLMGPAQVLEVFTRIVKEVLNQKIPAAYKSVERQSLSEAAVKHVLADVAHLVDSLRMVRGLRDRGRTMDRFFRDKFVLNLT